MEPTLRQGHQVGGWSPSPGDMMVDRTRLEDLDIHL